MQSSGQFERIIVLRFKYQTDLLDGLERMVKQQKIRNAVIISGIGSVRSYHFHTVSNGTFPSKNVYVKNPDGPGRHYMYERVCNRRPHSRPHHFFRS